MTQPLIRRLTHFLALPALAAISMLAVASSPSRYDYHVVWDQTYSPGDWPQALQGDLYLPERSGPVPVVLVVHGGSWQHGKRGDMAFVARQLASHGFAAFTVDYRLAPAYLYPAPVQDLEQAVAWLHAHAAEYHFDESHMGAWGYSAGAHLVAMLGTQANPKVHLQAVVAGGTPADLRQWPHSPIVKVFLGKNASEDLTLATQASPVANVSAGDPPFFLYHGAKDTLVEPDQPQRLAAALTQVGVPVEVHYLGHYGHILTALFPGQALDDGVSFLGRHLAASPVHR